MRPNGRIALKGLAFLALYVVIHFAYNWAPVQLVAVISGINESVFQHLKIGFFAYTLVNLGEYLIRRRQIQSLRRFVDSRLLATLLVPGLIFAFWYIAAAVYGPLGSPVLEVAYANLVMVLVYWMTAVLERDWEKTDFSPASRVWIRIVYGVLAFLFVRFTFRVQWTDLFQIP